MVLGRRNVCFFQLVPSLAPQQVPLHNFVILARLAAAITAFSSPLLVLRYSRPFSDMSDCSASHDITGLEIRIMEETRDQRHWLNPGPRYMHAIIS